MKKNLFLLLALIAFAACNKNPHSTGKTLVKVGGTKITEGTLSFLSDINPNFARQLSNPFGQKQIINSLVEQELLYQASQKEGIDHDPVVKAKIDLYSKVILAQAYVEAQATKEARKYFDANPKEFEKLKMSHIMVSYASPAELKAAQKGRRKESSLRSEQEALKKANEIANRLQKGEKFEEIAKKESDDIQTKELGGDLGTASKIDPKLTRRGFAPLLEKAFTLKVGEKAGPIKTATGYHLILVTQPAEVATFDEVQNFLLFKTRGEIRDKVLVDLKQKGSVVYSEGMGPEEIPSPSPKTQPEAPQHGHEHPHKQPHPENNGKN